MKISLVVDKQGLYHIQFYNPPMATEVILDRPTFEQFCSECIKMRNQPLIIQPTVEPPPMRVQ